MKVREAKQATICNTTTVESFINHKHLTQEDVKSPRSKRKRDASESSNDDTDDERPKKRGRPRMHHKETFKGFSDVEVRDEY